MSDRPPGVGVDELPYTTWGRRVGAAVIDYLLLAVFLFGLRQVFDLDDLQGDDGSFRTGAMLATAVLSLVVITAYFTIAAARTGRTIGKAMLGSRVVRPDGRLPSFSQALLRSFAYALGLTTCVLAVVDGVWALSDARHQALHDKLADTVVIDA